MVDPFSSPASNPSTSAIQHTNTGLIPQQSEEGCNDDPPPIPLPPAGGSNGTDPNINRGQPEQLAGGYRLSQLPNTRSGLNNLSSSENGAGFYVKVHDYGQSADSSAGKLNPDTNPFSTGSSLDKENSYGNSASTATSVSTTPYPISRTSSASSITACDGPGQEVVVDMPVIIFNGSNAHVVDTKTVATVLNVDVEEGLTTNDAEERLQKNGPNKLESDGGLRWYSVLGRQVSNSLTLVSIPIAFCFARSGWLVVDSRLVCLSIFSIPILLERLMQPPFFFPALSSPCASKQLSLVTSKCLEVVASLHDMHPCIRRLRLQTSASSFLFLHCLLHKRWMFDELGMFRRENEDHKSKARSSLPLYLHILQRRVCSR
ncbi:hypothetical protein EX30DRAFT_122211 [Ascodesmis nigricans]|uniref:Cation-transporting P-type ATPase N-terminal domain-containing protein n=1 Tax=Ascodesmis nigricans TaxID=341454 RepID=A0A4V3SI77_9PEZI|nr:hypothetical protein EX30DRAFT_122211 [Ascodesmis nigricans]